MSDEEEEEEGGRRRRAPLSRSRRLSSRRRRRSEEDEEEAEEGGGDEEGGATEATAEPEAGADEGGGDAEPITDAQEFTRPVSLPSTTGSGGPDFPLVGAPPAERWASFSGSARRFGAAFSHYLFGLGRTAQQQGQAFGRDVVKPFSSALLEAAISLVLLFAMAAAGVYVGRVVRVKTADKVTLTAAAPKVVQSGQNMDESFFSEGFNTKELHSRANRVLKNYLEALQDGDMRAAYDLLSPEWRSELSYESFQAGYRTTRLTAFSIGNAETVDQRHVKIKARIEVEEAGKRKTLEALYLAVLSPQGWRLDGGTFR